MVVKLMAVHPVDIDESVFRRNGTAAITVQPQEVEGPDGEVVPAYAVSADFFSMGTEQRNFRTLQAAMAFVAALVLAAEETARRLQVNRSTIEIQVEM
jgi:hypothetical protein